MQSQSGGFKLFGSTAQSSNSVLACLLLGGALSVQAQTLRIGSVSGSSGDGVELSVLMDSPSALIPSVVKWELIFPAQLLEIDGGGPEAGSVARQFGKSLTCRLRQSYAFVCILVGGQQPIRNGPIATFRFKIRDGARTGSSVVRIDQVEAATKDLQPLKFSGSEGRIEIR